jgi:hypothetical protein
VDEHVDGGPPSDAYGRVTDPERYRVLHGAARDLLDELPHDYSLDVLTGPSLDEDLARGVQIEETIRLQPESSGGAPLTIVLTTFPGLIVRYGEWHVEAYPACGCDACDEDPAELIGRFRERVATVVTEGLTESLTHGWRRSVLAVEVGGARSETVRPRQKGDTGRKRGVRSWPPW